MSEPTTPPAGARRVLAVLVGLFATWQLVAIPASNLMHFVPLRPTAAPLRPNLSAHQTRGTFTTHEPLQRAADRAGHALELWTEASGQEQGWSLFAPGPPPYSVFVATEFQWADGTCDTLRSMYEPLDYADPPPRAPIVHSRHYHFEVQFVCPVWYASPEAVARSPRAWADLPAAVGDRREQVRAWLRWRTDEYRAAHPHRGRPVAVVMKHRYVSTPQPGQGARAPRTVEERPFARWRPESDEMDAFDVVTMRFVPLVEANP
ncbi:MAG TPA: hypothetical protein VGE74_20845 [Gemmata sp.]